ncbi:TPR-like protein [Melanogaster broomeanus]|nr:TPR-like protein [Melanogaster broomeanus]
MHDYYKDHQESHVDDAIRAFKSVVDRCPSHHPSRSAALSNLAVAMFTSCQAREAHLDMDEPIRLYREVLDLRPAGHPDHLFTLINFSIALLSRFRGRGCITVADADEAEELLGRSLDICPPESHEYRREWIMLQTDIIKALMWRFERQGQTQDLEDAIHYGRAATQSHPSDTNILNNLAAAMTTRFLQQGNEGDLDEAIQHHRIALQLTPEGHPDHSGFLNNLAAALSTRFHQRGDEGDLDEAIQQHRTALQLRPEGHPDRSGSLNNLATTLSTRFEQGGDGKDLDEAIQHHRTALQLRPEGHPDCSASLNHLAAALLTRFQQQGDGKDLDEAIQHHRTALQLRPEGHPDHAGSLNNLANALSTRFEKQGDGKDLDEAIQHHRTALQLRPEGHPGRSGSLNNLANALSVRFEQRGDGKDLDEAIQHHRTALQLRSVGHPDRSASLNNLATALSTQFQQQGDGKDLDEAIQHHRTALQLRPEGHPGHSGFLNNLAKALAMRFEQQHDGKDLDEAIQHHRTALQLTSKGHPNHSSFLNDLAAALLKCFEQQPDDNIIQEALQYAYVAAQFTPASPLECLKCCLEWVGVAEEHKHPSALDAYTQSLHLLDSHISTTITILSRHQIRMHFPHDLSVNAASCALRHGNICHAVELLEQGRALHWTQLARFRTTLDDLQSCDGRTAILANQFHNLSAMLNRLTDVPVAKDHSIAVVEAKAWHYRNLVEEWNKVVKEIRTLKGFSQFLLPPLFTNLQGAACKGPVIVLVASKFSCDAIIVLHTQSPIHIQLQITWEEMCDLVVKHLQNIHDPHGPDYNVFVETMGRIWKTAIFPVVQVLKRFVQKNSRIWWSPTSLFTALPLHTAGDYQPGGSVLSKLFVSSYTPSLSALVKAYKDMKMTSDVNFVAIGQAAPDLDTSFQPLQYVDPELDDIGRSLPTPPVMFTKLTSSVSTRKQALHMLQDRQWFHLSCHGKQVLNEPFKSYFAMRDGPITLLDIINANISGHEFAFLSACETAMGDLSAPDEVIHLAAGLHFMGVKSVIGTLWSVGDEVAYKLVSAYYKEFCKNGTMDCTMAAKALHGADALLAKDNVPLVERAMFIHLGI